MLWQIILSTNITESSVTVPDVKYGVSFFLCVCVLVGRVYDDNVLYL